MRLQHLSGLEPTDIAAALVALQTEGFAMRGRFTPQAGADEWCERRLLARIHNYTVKRLRAEIEPVAARDFLRFLLRWQRVAADARMQGPDAVEVMVAQLEGFEAPAGAWETEILPADRRVRAELARRSMPGRSGSRGRASGRAPADRTAATECRRPCAPRRSRCWRVAMPRFGRPVAGAGGGGAECAGAGGPRVHIQAQGASFFDELVEGTGLLRSQVEEALAELVALGLVTSDSFGGLRALLVPSDRRPGGGRRRRRALMFGMEGAGRWALAHRARLSPRRRPDPRRWSTSRAGCCVTAWCSGACSARGRLAAAVARLARLSQARGARRDPRRPFRRRLLGRAVRAAGCGRRVARGTAQAGCGDAWVSVSGADPLNLVGILTPGPRLAALTGNRLLYRDGVPVALLAGGEVQFLTPWTPAPSGGTQALLQGAVPAPLVDLA